MNNRKEVREQLLKQAGWTKLPNGKWLPKAPKGHTERCFLRIGHQGPHLFTRCADTFRPLYWECQTMKCVEG